ncbi:hypothetical protein ABT332_11950 [Saccharomonospora azurea]|uniref:hypothetical protein n=1 Tax=Saccharomonospora azurea TaxID=40988 RepID=UPI00332ED58F
MTKEIDGIAHRADVVYTPQTATPFLPLPRARDLLLFRADVGNAVLTRAVRAGDGFAFDSDTLERLAALWEDLARRYAAAVEMTDHIATAIGPGFDFASSNHAEIVRSSGSALQEALNERIGYCEGMCKRFRAALGHYTSADNDAEITMTTETGKFE